MTQYPIEYRIHDEHTPNTLNSLLNAHFNFQPQQETCFSLEDTTSLLTSQVKSGFTLFMVSLKTVLGTECLYVISLCFVIKKGYMKKHWKVPSWGNKRHLSVARADPSLCLFHHEHLMILIY